jgi:16S rRNA (uracil1498-N3)-methyltransferase
MHRFHLPPAQCHGDVLELTGREAHHALHVLRLRQGDRITVLDGAGQELLCELTQAGRDRVQLNVAEKTFHPAYGFQITLLQAIPKGKAFESIVQKATELGAHRIVPIVSEHVVSKFAPLESARKTEKWRQVAIEAIKQCGSPWLPLIELPLTPAEFLAREERFELPLVAVLDGVRRHPRDCFVEFQAQHRRAPASVSVWIGPEGDFTPEESRAVQKAGAHPITLGPLVLRAETAAVYCLSVLNYELRSPAI